MRPIVFDLRDRSLTGLGRVARETVHAYRAAFPDDAVTVLEAGGARYSLRAQWEWVAGLRHRYPEAVWVWFHWDVPWVAMPRRSVVYVNDLIHLDRSLHQAGWLKRAVAQRWIHRAMHRAGRVVTGSQATAALLSVPLTWWIIARTRFGLRLRAVGEMPLAVDAAGLSVAWLRYRAILLCGLFAGLAGAYLSIGQNAGFSRDMTAGQGFIALAAIIFGKWRAWPACGACLIFGLLDAIAIRLQGVRVPGLGEVPVQLIQAMPYLLAMFLLAGFIGRAVAPKAAGVPYEKEH